VDADLAGNSYHVRDGREILRLRPDWVKLLMSRNPRTGTLQKDAYLFYEDGPGTNKEPRFFWPDEVAHFAPRPDPLATFRGMSWVTPVVREIEHDNQLNRHKQNFMENAATPNLAVVLDSTIEPAKFERFRELFQKHHRGPDKAGETLFLGGGADVTLVGQNYKQMDLKGIQGAGETRIAAAAGVPPIIVGLSEGLAAATYSNYGQARRAFGDRTMHSLWSNAAGSLARLIPTPAGSRLWYDSRQVAFLREDAKDAAEVAYTEAQTMRSLIEAGYTPASVQQAVTAGDYSMLAHSGLVSVQLQEPGASNVEPKEVAQ
jgi:HK97 family phage portal protein